MLNKVLIANRGEIAVRIIRACAEAGIRSVAIYTEPDRYGLHVKRASEAYSLGDDPLAGYLDAQRIVNLALETGCDAIHPGYGFLSENADFARLCEKAGITFIGPAASVIHRMGDKTQARNSMKAAGVPVTPGSDGNLASVDEALAVADTIGYPVMIKATSGGGGRGIRRCDNADELKRQYPRVMSEAAKAFGSAEVFLEKCIINPRHIEVQILADSHGNVVHLYERDCSIQRRNQKLIEIAPSPQLTPEQRDYIGSLAVRAAEAVGYVNAGTVEFLLSGNEVWFMEMNTRVQVEHTITEQITGVDIVREQLRIAAGLELSYRQHDIHYRGFALQFRINAEDPKNDFLPSFGRISHYYAPGGPGVRV
ncbi:MAG TPA: biotin carboxylase N-terminal domain-containing protein, partial [Pseudomonadales bacterium]